jgi:hypothetical protein
VAGYHSGTGSHQATKLGVVPASVPGSGDLQFSSYNGHVTTMLFQLSAAVVPNWFGVAVPPGIVDFTKPNIFFHPIPAQDGYLDSDYPTKTGKWPQLFYYMERLGYQVDGAIKSYGAPADQIVIMPFLTSAATNTGILPVTWQGIITDILTAVQAAQGGGVNKVVISEVVVSSFSVGYVYSLAFRTKAVGLSPLLTEVWDFDGYPKAESNLLVTTAAYKAIKYDQASEQGSFHVPLSRWVNYPSPPPNPDDPPAPHNGGAVHTAIRNFMFLHAATLR